MRILNIITAVMLTYAAQAQTGLYTAAGGSMGWIRQGSPYPVDLRSLWNGFVSLGTVTKAGRAVYLNSEMQYCPIGYTLEAKDIGFQDIGYQTAYVRYRMAAGYEFFSRLLLTVGPEGGYEIARYIKSQGQKEAAERRPGIDRPWDLGIHAGVRFSYKRFFLAAGYYHGLYKPLKTEVVTDSGQKTDLYTQNRYIQVGVGYRIAGP